MSVIETAKKDFTRQFYIEKIDIELLKAGALSDKKLKTSQLKKALKVALAALEDLPKDTQIKDKISEIEVQIAEK